MPLTSTPLSSDVIFTKLYKAFKECIRTTVSDQKDKEKRVYSPSLYPVKTVSPPSRKFCLNCSCSP